VGRDIEELRQFGDLIRTTLYWALGLSLALGLGGGLLTSRNFLHRIDAITGASRTIMDGNLSRRMPVAGTGDELDRLSVSLNQMLDQIERLMLGMKEVSSNIAHDMKTPLTRMRARVEAALRTDDKNQYRAALNQSIEESDSLLRTFNSLMSIARAESGNAREGFRPIDLGNVLNDVYELYEPLVEDAGGKLVLQLSGSLPVKADRQLLAQAISNLLDNAMKYGHTSELAITLAAQAKPETVEITVSDRGSGIPEEDRERVKDRFVRLDTSRTLPGNGLGLALVASIMRVHGGDLKLTDSAPGLKATLVLPKQATAI
jgi:signal transduction histidine kinase